MSEPAGPPPAAAPPVLNIANALTLLRLLLVPVFLAVLFAEGGTSAKWRLVAFGVFALAAITDRLDGDLARSRGLVTTFGTVADPIADKALTGAALVGLSVLGLVPWWVTVVIMIREIGITVLRFWRAAPRHHPGEPGRQGEDRRADAGHRAVPAAAAGAARRGSGHRRGAVGRARRSPWCSPSSPALDYVLRALRLRAAASTTQPG